MISGYIFFICIYVINMRYTLFLNSDQRVQSCVIGVKSLVSHYHLFFTVLVILMLILWTSSFLRLAIFVISRFFVSVLHISCFLLIIDEYIGTRDFMQTICYVQKTSLHANYSASCILQLASYSLLRIRYFLMLIQT